MEKTPEHRERIGSGQRKAWQTTRTRKPLGSVRLSSSGYRLVKIVEGEGHWRPEHVLMVEQEIGRPLRRGEHVHHINAIKTDNRPENLHLFATVREHSQAHGSLNVLLDQLLRERVIEFVASEGRYRWSRIT